VIQATQHKTQIWKRTIHRLTSLFYLFHTATENCLRLSQTHFTPQTRTRQDSLVLSASAVWTRHSVVTQ